MASVAQKLQAVRPQAFLVADEGEDHFAAFGAALPRQFFGQPELHRHRPLAVARAQAVEAAVVQLRLERVGVPGAALAGFHRIGVHVEHH